MKTLSNKTVLRSKIIYFLILGFAFLGCKKYFDPPDVFETQTVVNTKKRKVLLIGLDGITGEDMKTIAPPKLQTILANSKYSFDAISGRPVSDAGSWKTIMTGVNVSKHGVVDSTFDASEEELGHEHDEIPVFPTFIERLLETGKMKQSATITPWKTLSEKVFGYADTSIVVANDALVKDSTLKMLKVDKMDLIITNFNGANIAGLNYGFDAAVPQYKAAVLQIDTYIGEIMDALKARRNYAKEDWLVIITSTHGGLNKGYTSGTNRESNIFTAYYQPDIVGQSLPQLPSISSLTLPDKTFYAKLPAANATAYHLGTTGDFTIQLKVQLKSFPGGNSVIFSKTNHAYSGVNGWEFMLESSTKFFRVILGDGSGGTTPKYFLVDNVPAELNKWYTLTLKVYTENGKRYAQFYNNGKAAKAATEITGTNIGTTTAATTDLVLGVISSAIGVHSQMASQIAFYNTALSDQAIQNFVCQQEITTADPYYNNLIGYWPCNENAGTVLKNMAPVAAGKDLTVTQTGTTEGKWALAGAWSCGTGKDRLFLTQNADIYSQLFYWYGANINDKWGLDGSVWLSLFESEFIK